MTFYKKFTDNPLETREDYQDLVNDLFEPILSYFNPSKTNVDFNEGGAHFPMKSSYLEGFARPLWGIIPLVMGGGEFKHWSVYHEGITNGTNPQHPDFWGDTSDLNQHSVEMCAFGCLLAFIPEYGYEPLSADAKNNLALWLSKMQYCQMPQNNWLFFTILVQDGLRNIGRDDLVDDKVYNSYLEKIKNYYLDDGWYGDGLAKTVDHFGVFALHLYGLLYSRIEKNRNNEYSQLFIQRANIFAHKFKYWFAESGETLAQGRSLSYRFACAGFWGALAVSSEDNPALSMDMSQIKSLWVNHLKSWQDKPIFTHDGLLTRGFTYPNLVMCETYNSPTSPYWAMKAFMPLMLDNDHEFWTTSPEKVHYEKEIYPMPENQTIAQRVGGHSIIHYGSPIHEWLEIDKYNKFAYTTNFGFEVNSLQYANIDRFGDNILAFSFDNGDNWQMRMRNLTSEVNGSKLTTIWQSGKQEVKTTIDVYKNGICTRTHEFTLLEDAIAIESGFSIDNWYHDTTDLYGKNLTPNNIGVVDVVVGLSANPIKNNAIAIKGTNGISAIKSLDNYDKSAIVSSRIHSNVISPRTKVPFFKTNLKKGSHKLTSVFFAHPDKNTSLNEFISFNV